MVAYFDRGSFWYGNLLFSFYGLALLAAILFYRQENIYFRALAWIYGAEFMMRHFYFAPHPNYYTLLTMLAAMVFAPAVSRILPRHKLFGLFLIILLFARLGLLFNTVIPLPSNITAISTICWPIMFIKTRSLTII